MNGSAALYHTMKQGVADTPLHRLRLQRDGLVVEPQDGALTRTAVAILEAHDIADADLVTTESLPGLLPDIGIHAVEIDRGVLDQVAVSRRQLQHHVLATEFGNDAREIPLTLSP